MTYKRLGDYIQRITEKNTDDSLDFLVGISEQKIFREPAGKVNRENLSNHLIVNKGEFAYIPRMNPFKPLAIALSQYNHPILLSPSYVAFKIINPEELLPEYLLLFLSRKEFDRYAAFNAWSSTRDTFDWDKMQDVQIPVPSKEKQHEYVAIYRNLLCLVDSHEKSFNDLQLIADTYMEKLQRQHDLKKLGNYIREAGERNKNRLISKQAGLENKDFVAPKVKVADDKRDTYKVIKKNQFACNLMHVGRDMRLPVSLYSEEKPAIISPAYKIFEISQPDKVLPEFLLLFFKRPETDRLMAYMTDSSVRQGLEWDRLCEAELPVPPIQVQQSIVAIFHALEARKRLMERLKRIIKEISPILVKNAKDEVMRVSS